MDVSVYIVVSSFVKIRVVSLVVSCESTDGHAKENRTYTNVTNESMKVIQTKSVEYRPWHRLS
jgi:hypothetical protein